MLRWFILGWLNDGLTSCIHNVKRTQPQNNKPQSTWNYSPKLWLNDEAVLSCCHAATLSHYNNPHSYRCDRYQNHIILQMTITNAPGTLPRGKTHATLRLFYKYGRVFLALAVPMPMRLTAQCSRSPIAQFSNFIFCTRCDELFPYSLIPIMLRIYHFVIPILEWTTLSLYDGIDKAAKRIMHICYFVILRGNAKMTK